MKLRLLADDNWIKLIFFSKKSILDVLPGGSRRSLGELQLPLTKTTSIEHQLINLDFEKINVETTDL